MVSILPLQNWDLTTKDLGPAGIFVFSRNSSIVLLADLYFTFLIYSLLVLMKVLTIFLLSVYCAAFSWQEDRSHWPEDVSSSWFESKQFKICHLSVRVLII